MLATSAALTVVNFFSLRMRPEALRPVKWRLAVWPRKIFPAAVTLKRLRAPRCVFNFIFGFERFLGIAKTSLKSQKRPQKAVPTESKLRRETRPLLRLLRAGSRLPCGPGCPSALLGCQQSHQNVAFHARHRFDLADRKSTRLNSSHSQISYAVFCLKKKKLKLESTSLSSAMSHVLTHAMHHTVLCASDVSALLAMVLEFVLCISRGVRSDVAKATIT